MISEITETVLSFGILLVKHLRTMFDIGSMMLSEFIDAYIIGLCVNDAIVRNMRIIIEKKRKIDTPYVQKASMRLESIIPSVRNP